jgi:hypothetical protein
MKWAIIHSVLLASMFAAHGRAEPVRVLFEWVELDCSECPDLAARFQPKEGRIASTDASDPAFVDLQKRAHRRVLAQHHELVELGAVAEHRAQLENDTRFDLSLDVRSTEQTRFEVSVDASLRKGTELDASIKPGTKLTPQQREGIRTEKVSFSVRLSAGQSWAVGGLDHRSKSKLHIVIVGIARPDA